MRHGATRGGGERITPPKRALRANFSISVCCTIDVRPNPALVAWCGLGRIRTGDRGLNGNALYLLSYEPTQRLIFAHSDTPTSENGE